MLHYSIINPRMGEKGPIPISRGIEIQEIKVEEIRQQALERYKELTAISKAIEGRIDAALSPQIGQDNLAELAALFDRKHELEEIGRELETMILRSFEATDALQERWSALQSRLIAIETPFSDQNN